MNAYKDRIMIFQAFLKKAIGIMAMQKKQLKTIQNVRQKQDDAGAKLIAHCMKFEDVGIAYYTETDFNKRILTHPDKSDLKETIDEQ